MLLSATLDGDVDRLVRAHLREPVLHELDANKGSVTTMAHHVLVVGGFRDKVEAAVALIEANPRSIVFTRTREGATELAEAFGTPGIEALDLHGNLSQRVRERNLHKFSSGKASVVVATDVAARGIHVDSVGLVVHFDAPADAKAYLHRSGRTARAGNEGTVITLMTDDQVRDVRALTRAAGINPTTTRLNVASHPILAELAPGVRVEVPGGLPQAAPAANSGGGGRSGGRSSGGGGRSSGGRNRSRNGQQSGGQQKSGGSKPGASAKSGAPASRNGSRRTPSGGGSRGGNHSAASFSSGRRG
jgi:superfamily II DNA/RNA helicase